jgi:hypothetical protein
MASTLDMLGRLTDQGICLADLHSDDICAYAAAGGVHVSLRGWQRAHARGLAKEYISHVAAHAGDAAAADAAYLDSVDWVTESDCPCCSGGHLVRAGVLFSQWLEQLQELDGVREWTPLALPVLQVLCCMRLCEMLSLCLS